MQIIPGNSHDPCIWPHPVTPARDLCASQLNLRTWVNWALFCNFAESANSLERWKSIVSARDVSRDFFCSRWASLLNQLSVFTRLTVLQRCLMRILLVYNDTQQLFLRIFSLMALVFFEKKQFFSFLFKNLLLNNRIRFQFKKIIL